MTAQRAALQATTMPGRRAAVALLAGGLAAAAVAAGAGREPVRTDAACCGERGAGRAAARAGARFRRARPGRSRVPRGRRRRPMWRWRTHDTACGRHSPPAACACAPARPSPCLCARPAAVQAWRACPARLRALSATGSSTAAANLTEWYVNGPAGLEQGFTLARRPSGVGPLTLTLSARPSGGARRRPARSRVRVAGLSRAMGGTRPRPRTAGLARAPRRAPPHPRRRPWRALPAHH